MANDKYLAASRDLRPIRFNDYYEQRDWSDCSATHEEPPARVFSSAAGDAAPDAGDTRADAHDGRLRPDH